MVTLRLRRAWEAQAARGPSPKHTAYRHMIAQTAARPAPSDAKRCGHRFLRMRLRFRCVEIDGTGTYRNAPIRAELKRWQDQVRQQDDPGAVVGYGERSAETSVSTTARMRVTTGSMSIRLCWSTRRSALAQTVQSLLGCHGFLSSFRGPQSIAFQRRKAKHPLLIRSLAVSRRLGLLPR